MNLNIEKLQLRPRLQKIGSSTRRRSAEHFVAVVVIFFTAFGGGCHGAADENYQASKNPNVQLLEEVLRGPRCRAEKTKFLISSGTSPDVKTRMGTSVLQLALEMRGNDCAAVFLQNGADILSVNTNGQNAVHSAVIGGSSELVGQLLRAGAGADIPDIQGVTPLMIAAYTGNEKAIRILLDAGADTCRRDMRGRSADNLAKLSSKDWSANLKCKRRPPVLSSGRY